MRREVRPAARLRDHPLRIAVAGLAVVMLAAAAYWVPVMSGGSVREMRATCGSGLAQSGQAVQFACTNAGTWAVWLAAAAAGGVALAAAGIFLAWQQRRSARVLRG